MIAVIGYVLVFVVLCFLWFVLEIMRVILAPKKPKQKAENVQHVKEQPAAVPEPVAASNEMEEEELVAVLTAAVAASLNTSTYNLRIKSFRRINTVDNAWSSASRIDAVNKL